MIIDYILSSFRNLFRHKIRTFLTILGIVIGISSVTIIFAVGSGGQDQVVEVFKSFGINGLIVSAKEQQTGRQGLFNYDDMKYIEGKIPDVKSVMPLVSYFGSIKLKNLNKDCILWGIDEKATDVVSLIPKYGRNINLNDVKNLSKSCVIDTALSKYLYKRENISGKKINLIINGKSVEFTVVGIVGKNSSPLDNIVGDYIPSFVYIPYTTMQKICDFQYFDKVAVKIKDSADLDKTGEKIKNLLLSRANTDSGYYVENMVKQKKKIENIIGIITIIISTVAAISLIVGGIGIMTIMLVAVNERKKEIGIKKAVGATKTNILVEFIFEALIITLIGGIIGLIIGILGSSMAGAFLGFKPKLSVGVMLEALLFCMIIGIIFSVYPAKKAAELNPIDALRYE